MVFAINALVRWLTLAFHAVPFQIMDDLWQAEGLTLDMRPYECIATWHDGGMLQIVKDADTTAQIHHRYGGKLGAYKDSTFADWIRDNNAGEEDYTKAVDLFVRSCAGYCVATYVMGIGDRHNDNIMVSKSGRYFHIDFGHFLGNFKYQVRLLFLTIPCAQKLHSPMFTLYCLLPFTVWDKTRTHSFCVHSRNGACHGL